MSWQRIQSPNVIIVGWTKRRRRWYGGVGPNTVTTRDRSRSWAREEKTYVHASKRSYHCSFQCHNATGGDSSSSTSTSVRIGSVERIVPDARSTWSTDEQSLIPRGYLAALQSDAIALSHLQWMLQKDALGQDCLLIGTADSSVYRRRLVLGFAELIQQPLQVLTVSRHTTESDLKQRRLLQSNTSLSGGHVDGAGTSIVFQDQAPVRAARHGHWLFLDGLHRAERNVLATLNNLLENREMPLDSGHCFVSAHRYKQLQDAAVSSPHDNWMIPVSSRFRVVASLTVSSSSSHASGWLDPPVRSRFQIRRVDATSAEALYTQMMMTLPWSKPHRHQQEQPDTNSGNHTDETMARQLAILSSTLASPLSSRGARTTAAVTTSTTIGHQHQQKLWFTAPMAVPALYKSWRLFPRQSRRMAWERVMPLVKTTEPRFQAVVSSWAGGASIDALQQAYDQVISNSNHEDNVVASSGLSHDNGQYLLESIQSRPDDNRVVQAQFHWQAPNAPVTKATKSNTFISSFFETKAEPSEIDGDGTISVAVPSGGIPPVPLQISLDEDDSTLTHSAPLRSIGRLVWTKGLQLVATAMLQEHAIGRDVLLVSPPGEGKNAMARYFCDSVGYRLHLFPLYKEMTATDLLLRRLSHTSCPAPENDGEARRVVRDWDESPLLLAARTGQVCVLDGIDKIDPETLATLQGFLCDREVSLPDGTKYKRLDDRDMDERDLTASTTMCAIHPSFRVIALASIAIVGGRNAAPTWLSEEVFSMFATIALPAPSRACLTNILRPQNTRWARSADRPNKQMEQLLDFHEQCLLATESSGLSPLSIRALLRLARNVDENPNSLYRNLRSSLMVQLMPPTQQSIISSILKSCGIVDRKAPIAGKSTNGKKRSSGTSLDVEIDEQTLRIGNFVMARRESHHKELVPAPFFFDIPIHVEMIQTLLREWNAGERAFLLLGNQGTGKNKICDRLCELANFEREYMQLHRDSTIGQLTISPSLEDGKIVWKDSPLVRAVVEGRALVIDEADKAPPEVVAVLKSLVEDGELLLADGRRILRNARPNDTGNIIMHPDFTVWVLANRPGKLFHGNRFEILDCFSSHVVPNPDTESEIKLLQAYAPDVEKSLLRRISVSFDELRSLFESGDVSYPYSTREAVSVAKHLQMYPDDEIVAVLHNVLDMDSYNESTYDTLGEVFRRHGFPFEKYGLWATTVAAFHASAPLSIQYKVNHSSEGSSTPPPLSEPKIGKWDEENEAHVGGNQWQGGTGGSDTAGLGGRGGPYRLDRGHKIHQVSDQAKAEVSDEARTAARKIAKKALADRLTEIGMSESEHETYEEFIQPILSDVANLRAALEAVSYRSSERDWIKRQRDGELDDSRLIEGIAGELNVYKRRGLVEPTPDNHNSLQRKKRLRFVVDCSGSMYRFNGYDQRLTRCLQVAALVMLCFEGLGEKFEYSIVAHSGDSKCIELISFGQNPPSNDKERLEILRTMVAHSQYCESGDHTLGAIEQAVADVSHVDGDTSDAVVIAISDANLERYGIRPHLLNRAMRGDRIGPNNVKTFCIFIASFGDEAETIKRELPPGRAFVCRDSSDLPGIVRNILTIEIA